ncbi:MAG TPA: DUF3892 domain-containing protein, partial [Nitriliruptorales bacterium]
FERPLDPAEDLSDVLDDLLGDLLDPTEPPPLLRFNVTLDPPPVFEFVRPASGDPYTRLTVDGTIEVRLAATDPTSPPLQTFPLHAPVRLALALVPGDPLPVVGLRYDGTDGPPDPPVTSEDIDAIFDSPPIRDRLMATTIDLAAPLVAGLNPSRFPEEAGRPKGDEWAVALTLLPARDGTDDAFFVTVGPPGTTAVPQFTDSFLRSRTGMGVAFSRGFLDLMLGRGAEATVGDEVEGGAEVRSLTLRMLDTAIEVKGHVKKVVTALPDVDVRFNGPMIPHLVRGTTVMAFDTDLVQVKVDEGDEIFYAALKWFVTIGSAGLLFTGVGSLTALGILSWVTLVQEVWNADVDIANAPGTLRDGLANALGAELSALADSLDDDHEVDPILVDATPDSLDVVDGNMLLYAQILLVPLQERLRLAEYAQRLQRFGIIQLNDGRRFRTQELARLIRSGKVTVPGFHEVDGRYVRADPDNKVTNNLLEQFERNETSEVVV